MLQRICAMPRDKSTRITGPEFPDREQRLLNASANGPASHRSVKLGTFGMEWAFARRNHAFAKPRECTEGQQPRPQSELSPTPRAREQREAHTRARPGNPETARHRLPLRWRNGLVFDTSAPTPCRSAASVAA